MKKLLIVVALLAGVPLSAQHIKPVSVFVSPQTRDGFVDVDQGVIDSINDVVSELRRLKSFTVVASEADSAAADESREAAAHAEGP